ncbi:MAG: HNH endonuclease [Saprospiraceae bacterium]
MEPQTCVICERALGDKNISKHHLIPKSKGGSKFETILIHNICHQKIHSIFSEKELKDTYHTVEALKQTEEIQKFVQWVAKKDSSFYQRNRRRKRK